MIEQSGASTLEVLLSIGVVLAISPFMYAQIVSMTHDVQDITMANKIVQLRDGMINFLRVNQTQWPDFAEIKLSESDLKKLAPFSHAGFIDKYKVSGASITDVYLAFDVNNSDFRSANVAKYIGQDAAIVREDGIAYSENWAVSAPEDFNTGDLIFKISRDFGGTDKSKFLHRGTMGEDNLNQMNRELYMDGFNLYDVNTVDGTSVKIFDVDAVFLNSDILDTDAVYFSAGANINATDMAVGYMRVTGDTNGFRSIVADKLNGERFTTNGRIVVDRATIGNSVNVSGNLILKSAGSSSVSGFSGISANKLLVPYISATDIMFYENFGITVSGELLMTSRPPLQIGSWYFPTTTPPSFSKFILTRASIPSVPDAHEFKKLTSKDWYKN